MCNQQIMEKEPNNSEEVLFTDVFNRENFPEKDGVMEFFQDVLAKFESSEKSDFKSIECTKKFVLENFGGHLEQDLLFSFLDGFFESENYANSDIRSHVYLSRNKSNETNYGENVFKNNERFYKEKGIIFALFINETFRLASGGFKKFSFLKFNKGISYLAKEMVLNENKVKDLDRFDLSDYESEFKEFKKTITKELVPILSVFLNNFVETSTETQKEKNQEKRTRLGKTLARNFSGILPENEAEIKALLEEDSLVEKATTREDLPEEVDSSGQTIAELQKIRNQVKEIIKKKNSDIGTNEKEIKVLKTCLAEIQASIKSALEQIRND